MPEVSRRHGGRKDSHEPVVALLVALLAGSLSACQIIPGKSDSTAKPATIQIVAEGPFTGDQAAIGMGALQAVKLAVDDFNKNGGVHGTRVQLVIWDDHHDPKVAAGQQERGIVDVSVLGMVGPMNADVALISAPRLQNAQPPMPFISESVGDAKLTDAGAAVAHRVSARNDQQAALAAQFLINRGAQKVEIIDSGTDYSRPMADVVESSLHTNAPAVATERATTKSGGKDFRATVARVKAFSPDWVYLADEGPEAIILAQQLTQAGLKIGQNIQLLVSDQVKLAATPGVLDGAYASAMTADPQSLPSAAGFVSAFSSKYGKDAIAQAGPFYGSAYAATQVLLQAINASPVKDAKISRADVLSELSSNTFTSILGPIKFDTKGDVQKTVITILHAEAGKIVPVTAVRS